MPYNPSTDDDVAVAMVAGTTHAWADIALPGAGWIARQIQEQSPIGSKELSRSADTIGICVLSLAYDASIETNPGADTLECACRPGTILIGSFPLRAVFCGQRRADVARRNRGEHERLCPQQLGGRSRRSLSCELTSVEDMRATWRPQKAHGTWR